MTERNELEIAFITVARAFADSPEGGAFFLKYVLIADDESGKEAVEFLYQEILKTFDSDKAALAQKVIESLKIVRKHALNDRNAKEFIEQQIEGIIKYKAMLDHVHGKPADDFLKGIINE
jgi:hypothetical protein